MAGPAVVPSSGSPWRKGWQRLVFPGVFLVTLGNTVSGAIDKSDGWGTVVGIALVGAFCVAYLRGLVLLATHPATGIRIIVPVLLAIFVAEIPFAHERATTMLIFVGVLAIAARFGRSVPFLVVLVAITLFLPPAIPSWHAELGVGDALGQAIVFAAMFAFFGLMRANVELTHARAEIASLAAEGERQRIARDLHDLLGHSLTTITLKAALAKRLADRGEAERAAIEIGEVEELTRRTLADVRAAVSGYREVSLASELAGARELLRTLGIRAELPAATEAVRADHHELFGWVVREGVTNVVRHAEASTCIVRAGNDWIEILDDGSGRPGETRLGVGHGLRGLRERVDAAGGTVEVGRTVAGWRLRVEMPSEPSA